MVVVEARDMCISDSKHDVPMGIGCVKLWGEVPQCSGRFRKEVAEALMHRCGGRTKPYLRRKALTTALTLAQHLRRINTIIIFRDFAPPVPLSYTPLPLTPSPPGGPLNQSRGKPLDLPGPGPTAPAPLLPPFVRQPSA
jgi:hypothetical protein